MALQLILASSDTEKTHYLYKQLIRQSMEEADRQFFAIVPEQFTMATQRLIVEQHPDHATKNIDIVSFNRLAYRIFEELSVEMLKILDDTGKAMVLRRCAAQNRADLGLFAGHLDQNGFIGHLKSMLSELYQYGVDPSALRGAADEAKSPLLRAKLEGILAVYETFRKEITDRYITAEEVLEVLCRVLPRSELIRNAVITLDGFTGFTPVQYRLIRLFLNLAGEVRISVTLDPAEGREQALPQELFYMSKHMILTLRRLAQETGCPLLPEICLAENTAKKAELLHLERNLYRFRTGPFSGVPRAIELAEAENPGREVAWAAARIHRMVREEGIRYREIAVIAGDPEGYRYQIEDTFRREKIPFFMDHKKSILETSLVEFIRAFLEMLQQDFSYETTFRFLKTYLLLPHTEELDRLENYCLAVGIRGWKQWKEPWTRLTPEMIEDTNLQKINALREQIVDRLLPAQELFARKNKTVREMTESLFSLMEACQLQQKMEAESRDLALRGEMSRSKAYEQVWGLVLQLLDRLVSLLGEEAMSRREFSRVLEAGFSELTVGVIPMTADQVLVGDLTRTRLGEIRVLIFLGVNEGSVPGHKDSGGILTDPEREYLKALSIELAPTAREDSFMQRYYLYLLLTRPAEHLILSYADCSQEGKALRPSVLIAEIRRIFPELPVLKACAFLPESEPQALTLLTEGLREYETLPEHAELLELYRSFSGKEDQKERLAMLTDAAFLSYTQSGISRAAAKALYGQILSGSVTRLESYAACACAHFLKYGLQLVERQEKKLAAVDIGNLFHQSIDTCFKKLTESGRSLVSLSGEERKALVREAVAAVAASYQYQILADSARNQYLSGRIERMTDRTLWALAKQLEKGDFEPVGFEVSFSADDGLKAMRIPLKEGEELHLRGKIDRVDECQTEGKVYVKIMDYKSGSTSFDLAAIYYGRQLQLVLYIDAALEMAERRHPGKQPEPAALLYYHIQDPYIKAEAGEELSPEETEERILKELKMSGLLNADPEVIGHLEHRLSGSSLFYPVKTKKDGGFESAYLAGSLRFQALREYVREKVKQDGEEILMGETGCRPFKNSQKNACTYCAYHAVCGFDNKVPGYRYRTDSKIRPEEIWKHIMKEDERDGVDSEAASGDPGQEQ